MNAMLRISICLILVFIVSGCQDAEESLNQDSTELLDYEVIEEKDISYAGTPRKTYRIMLNEDKLPNEDQMRRTTEVIWKEGNENLSEFTIFVYMPEMNTDDVAYAVAEFRRSGLTDLKIQDYALYGTKWRSQDEETMQADKARESEKQAEGVEEYAISLAVSKTSSRQVEISIETNFPDGTNFLVSVDREYQQKGNSESYAGEIFSKDIAVENRKIELSLDIDDSGWHSEFQQKKKQFEGMDIFSDISNISPEVEVWVLFSPYRDQPTRVLEVLGENGENIKGVGAKKTGEFTTYSVSKQVSVVFSK